MEPCGQQLLDSQLGQVKIDWPNILDTGSNVTLMVRPEDIRLKKPLADTGAANSFRGQVMHQSFHGEHIEYLVNIAGVELVCQTHPSFVASIGETLSIEFDQKSCVVLHG